MRPTTTTGTVRSTMPVRLATIAGALILAHSSAIAQGGPDHPNPNDVRAFIDIFTDIAGLFVINNESGWYEGWMIHDLTIPDVASPRPDGHAQFGKLLATDAMALAAMGTHHNIPGQIFTMDGSA